MIHLRRDSLEDKGSNDYGDADGWRLVKNEFIFYQQTSQL